MSTGYPAVAIIGGGFSGLLTALHLLTAADGPCVRLVERRGAFGRGAAYASTHPEHLLNVRAANMSAFADRPAHFIDWLRRQEMAGSPPSFARRGHYGDYLQAILRAAVEEAEAGRLILEPDEAVAAMRRDGRWRVELAMGRGFEAEALVLAVGNLAPHAPPGLADDARESGRWFGDPWDVDPEALPEEGRLLLLGTGLTMVDVAIAAAEARPRLKLVALSRHGLLPRRHLAEGPAPAPWRETEWKGSSAAGLLRAFRRAAIGQDWRVVLDGLRPHVQAIWRDWPETERRRFLRHLRPRWDVHRHRLSPQVASRLDHLVGSGTLSFVAGRLRSIAIAGSGLEAGWTGRGTQEMTTGSFAAAVNCTGPRSDLSQTRSPLLRTLMQVGAVRPDGFRLGLEVDRESRAVDREGRAQPDLRVVGPLTRGAFWEITSVPDIRTQAAACAAALRADLAVASPAVRTKALT